MPRITSVPEPLSDEVARRTRRYLIQMGIRIVCFIGAVATWGRVPGWISWLLIAGAVVLPYIAVILANAGRERPDDAVPLMTPRALGSGADGDRTGEDGRRD
ncbi:DUF3099 domain-containing protein [Pengzhenrongella frigida]|uniref:DUF3099 domain-containing protein n=1 Tax=Pengzhenrongella frigida TaxID=1259133 RepID=A0A4V1ZH26_9MICO|nr:DUF3099 domain-containing protein [Cellulomonas sp. HLT2-17]